MLAFKQPLKQLFIGLILGLFPCASLVYGYSGQKQLQVDQEQLYFVTEKLSYQYADAQFTLRDNKLNLLEDVNTASILDQFVKVEGEAAFQSIRSQKIQENCQISTPHVEKDYASGVVECALWNQVQRLPFEFYSEEIWPYTKPRILLTNYKKNQRYYIGLSVDDRLRTIAYIVFSKNIAPELIEAPMDCQQQISERMFNWNNRLFCYNWLDMQWFAFDGKTRIQLAAPCNKPQQLLVYKQALWAFQYDLNRSRNEGFNVCQFDDSLKRLTAHFQYVVDIPASLRASGLPLVPVANAYALHKESDNGPLIGYRFNLKSHWRLSPRQRACFT